ncbi:MAG: FAD-dependent oxidoreductase [Bacteroidetes bacterium]|nr:FAD-dependent oxidoreductase [Bacteroidota bacterium]
MEKLDLNLQNFQFEDLFTASKLEELTFIFYTFAEKEDLVLFQKFKNYKEGTSFTEPEISEILIQMGELLNEFISIIFGIKNINTKIEENKLDEKIIFKFKKDFFIRNVLKKYNQENSQNLILLQLQNEIKKYYTQSEVSNDFEKYFAIFVIQLLELDKFARINLSEEVKNKIEEIGNKINFNFLSDEDYLQYLNNTLKLSEKYLAASYFQKNVENINWITFKVPKKIDPFKLVDYSLHENNLCGHEAEYRHREGFDLTDERYNYRQIANEVDYCIFCHDREKDSCSTGFVENNSFKKNQLGLSLNGCPLDQKISESHKLESLGKTIGALAIIMIDNPMCPGTGHRICNDCMKGCIYQKQEPVNIPQIETRILTDVLNLPWGFEIYSLLTRWNPLNILRPFALKYNGKKILVVGMGPAGYTLSHYLLNEGFGVVGIDGLKIEPEFKKYVDGNFLPIKDYNLIKSKLSERVFLGFGGVSEYGITVRWDKNFLSIIYINLLRRKNFKLYDGVRFGGTISVDDAWEYGFDHIALATGAGKPTFIDIKNNLIRGIRKASDFLMSLQLSGAGKKDSLVNIQIQLPAIIIGGGLTAIDTATELLAYYPVQVLKIKKRFNELCRIYNENEILKTYDQEEKILLQNYLFHADEIEIENERAKINNELPDYIPLIRKWGGVKICYRKNLVDAPAYKLNHEEIIKAFEEGIEFSERMNPKEAIKDEFGSLKEIIFEEMVFENGKWNNSGILKHIPVKTLLIAAGTVPNIMYEHEHQNTFKLDEWNEYFESFDFNSENNSLIKKNEDAFLTSYSNNGKYISFYGDNHPEYAGNVVKAMASAKNGYKKITQLILNQNSNNKTDDWKNFTKKLDDELIATVVKVERLTPTIVEVIIHAPQAAKKFKAGQFFRLQNYEVDSLKLNNTLLMMEGLALTGAWSDKEKGLLSLITLEMGVSSKLCSTLKPKQKVVCMGPTGEPTEIEKNSTVLLLGGGLGNAVHFSIAKAFKEAGSKVIYFAGYKKKIDLFKQDEIEKNTDVVVFSVDSGEKIIPWRKQDKTFVGNILQAMIAYAKGELGEVEIPLNQATRIIAIGSDRMMAAVASARHTILKPYLNPNHVGIASINSPMQCMMKAICAQCLQRHVDHKTGKEEFVFSCVNQDQCMDDVDFTHLDSRLKQNTLLEKISNRWFDYISDKNNLERI